MHHPSFAIFPSVSKSATHRHPISRRTRGKPAHLVEPNHSMLSLATFLSVLLTIASIFVNTTDHCAIISTHSSLCYSMHTHPSHRSLSVKITRNIHHVTRSTDSPHPLSIAFVLYYSSLYDCVQNSSLVDRLARYVWVSCVGLSSAFGQPYNFHCA